MRESTFIGKKRDASGWTPPSPVTVKDTMGPHTVISCHGYELPCKQDRDTDTLS